LALPLDEGMDEDEALVAEIRRELWEWEGTSEQYDEFARRLIRLVRAQDCNQRSNINRRISG
jgi:hypothetical protein